MQFNRFSALVLASFLTVACSEPAPVAHVDAPAISASDVLSQAKAPGADECFERMKRDFIESTPMNAASVKAMEMNWAALCRAEKLSQQQIAP